MTCRNISPIFLAIALSAAACGPMDSDSESQDVAETLSSLEAKECKSHYVDKVPAALRALNKKGKVKVTGKEWTELEEGNGQVVKTSSVHVYISIDELLEDFNRFNKLLDALGLSGSRLDELKKAIKDVIGGGGAPILGGTLSCTGSCTGHGCYMMGCRPQGSDSCTGCQCNGDGCSGCTCTRTMSEETSVFDIADLDSLDY